MSAPGIPIRAVPLGRIVATASALQSLTDDDILIGIQRHQAGDWGLVQADDRRANEQALIQGGIILSAYEATNGIRFWILTEAELTTVLLPEDY